MSDIEDIAVDSTGCDANIHQATEEANDEVNYETTDESDDESNDESDPVNSSDTNEKYDARDGTECQKYPLAPHQVDIIVLHTNKKAHETYADKTTAEMEGRNCGKSFK